MIDNGLYVDKELKRHSSYEGFAATNAAPVLIAKSSAKRVRITFINQGLFPVSLFQETTFDPVRFIQLPSAGGILALDINDYGSMIQGRWQAQGSGGTTNVSVIDTVEM